MKHDEQNPDVLQPRGFVFLTPSSLITMAYILFVHLLI